MRLISLLLVVALATSAGCFGKDDDSGETPTPTTPTPTTPTGSTPTTPTTPDSTNQTPPEPVKPAPREVANANMNFAQAPADPQNPVQSGAAFTVPAGYMSLTLNVTWVSSAPVPLAPPSIEMALDIVDADGAVIANCPGPAPGAAAPEPCSAVGNIPATGGEFTPRGHGGGPYTAAFTVVAMS